MRSISDLPSKRFELSDLNTVGIQVLQAQLWGTQPPFERSTSLTPLYVHRYYGPRSGRALSFHPFWQLTYVFAGQGGFLPDLGLPLQRHALVLIPGELRHTEYADEDMDTLWIGMQGSCLHGLPSDRPRMVMDRDLEPMCEQLWLTAQQRNSRVGPELDGLLRTILFRFLRLEASSKPRMLHLDTVVSFIHEHLDRELTVTQLADMCGYSEGHFHRLFKEHIGVAPNEYIIRCRIEKAQQLMRHSTLGIARIARMVGYDNPAYFSRLFKKATGRSPSAHPYRAARPA